MPLDSKSAMVVAGALMLHVYLDLCGFPTILRSDNGPEFTAELTRELNRLIGTVQIFGSAYHPQAQALVEGSHRPTEDVLRAFVQEFPTDWAAKLPMARWAWNTSAKQALAGLTPYEVVTGLPPRTPLSWLALPASEAVTADVYVQELLKGMEKVHELVRQAQERRAEQLQRRAVAGAIPRRLEVGEHVLVRRPPSAARGRLPKAAASPEV